MLQFFKRWIQDKVSVMRGESPSRTAERVLILRQLFILRQDVEFLKQLATRESEVE